MSNTNSGPAVTSTNNTNPQHLSPTFTADAAIRVVVGGIENATQNRLNIQRALDLGQPARILSPGVVYVNGSISMPSNSLLYIGAGTILKQAPGSNITMIYNASRMVNPTSIAAGALTSSGKTATLAVTGIGALFPVNSFISILSFNEVAYNGVWRVDTSSANSITWNLSNTPSASPATGSGTYTTAETNVNIAGDGAIDYDVNNNGGNTTLYGSSAVIFMNCDTPFFVGPKVLNAKKYGVWFTNTSNGICRAINMKTASDGVHVCGPQRGVMTIEDISGYCGDDMVGLSNGDNPTGELSRGEMDHLRIKNINGENSQISLISIVGGGNQAIRYHTVEVDGVYGTCQNNAINLYEYTSGGATLTATYIEKLILRNIMPTAWNDSGCVYIGGTTTGVVVEHLVIENVMPTASITGNQNVIQIDAKANVKRMTVRSGAATFAAASQGAFVNVTSTGTLLVTELDGIECVPQVSARNSLIGCVSTATMGKVMAKNCRHISAGAGYFMAFAASCDVWVSDCESTTTNSAINVTNTGAVVNLYTHGWKNNAGSTTPILAVSGATLNWFGDCDMGSSAKGAPSAGSTFRANGNMRVDGSTITTSVVGDTFFNTNAAWSSGSGTDKSGFYGYNGSAYTKLFGPA